MWAAASVQLCDMHLAIIADTDAAFRNQLDDLRIQLMLDIVDASFERIDRIVLAHYDRTLRDNRTLVVLGIREMNRNTCDLHSGIPCILNAVRATE